jgi:hypothetical protein
MATLFMLCGSHVRAGFHRAFAAVLVLGLMLPLPVAAQTVVSGAITSDAHWNLEGSPYIVSGDVILQNGAKLTIDPGVTVYMGAHTNLLVQSGGISAQGTAQNRIQVLSEKTYQQADAAPGDWGQWVFLPGTVDTRLEHVLIEQGHGLVVNGSSPVFNNLDLRAHAGAAITVDLEASPSGYGIQASGNTINGIAVPAGDITGDVQWNLRGIPYLVQGGTVSVGVSPGIASVTPAVVERGQTATITLTGTRLETLSALVAENGALTFEVFSGGSSTQRFAQVQVAPDALSGPARLLAKTDAGEIVADGLLTVSGPAPTLTALAPTRVFTGEENTEITVQGRNFSTGSEVVVNAATVTTRFVSDSELVADLPAQSSPGQLSVQVRTPLAQDADQYVYSNALTLTVDAWVLPLVSISPTPVALPPDGQLHNIVVRLSKSDHRAHTLEISVGDPAKADLSPASVTIPTGETEATVGIRPLAAGTTALIVDSATLAQVSVPLYITADFSGISIAYARPVGVVFGEDTGEPVSQQRTLVPAPVGVAVGAVLKGASPRAWTAGGETSLVIDGIGIPSGATVEMWPADGVVLGEALTDDSHERMNVPVTTAPDAPTGLRRLIVRDAAGRDLVFSDPARAVVEIFPDMPVIESVTPAFALPNSTVALSVRGRNLKGGSLQILPEDGIRIEPDPQVSIGGDELSFRVEVLAEATPGIRVVQVTTPVGATPPTADTSNTFTIASHVGETITPIVAPLVGVVVGDADQSLAREEIRSPNSLLVGVLAGAGITDVAPLSAIVGSEVEITVRGAGLDAVSAVSFTPDTGLVTGAPSVNDDGTELRFTVQLAGDAPLGYRRLALMAQDLPVTFDKATDGAFLVTEPVPELDSVTPQVLLAGQNPVRMTVRGRNFRNIREARIEPPADIQVSGPFELNENGTELQFIVTIGEAAAPGERAVVVATPAGESPATVNVGNLVHIAQQTGPTYGGIASPLVGVVVGQDDTAPCQSEPVMVTHDVEPMGQWRQWNSNAIFADPYACVDACFLAWEAQWTNYTCPSHAPSSISGGLANFTVTGCHRKDNPTSMANGGGACTLISTSCPDGYTLVDLENGNQTCRKTEVQVPACEPDQVETTFVSAPVGVFIPETAISRTQSLANASTPVGVVVGGAALSMQPAGWLRGASGTITITGQGLDAIVSLSVSPDTGLLIGSPTASQDGTALTFSIAVAPDTEAFPRVLRLLKADGLEIVFSGAGAERLGIGALPSLASMSPIVLAQGQGYVLTIRGADLRSVIGVEVLGAGLRFANKDIVWSSDGSGELITVPVYVEPAAAPGNRVLRLLVPGGATAVEPTSSNTVTVVPQ